MYSFLQIKFVLNIFFFKFLNLIYMFLIFFFETNLYFNIIFYILCSLTDKLKRITIKIYYNKKFKSFFYIKYKYKS